MNFTFLALAVFAITVFGSKLDVLLNVLEEELADDSADFPTSPIALEEELAIALEEELARRSYSNFRSYGRRARPKAQSGNSGVDFNSRKFKKDWPEYFTPYETNQYGKKDYKIDLGLGLQTVANEPGNASVLSLLVDPSEKHTVGRWQCNKDLGWSNQAKNLNFYSPQGPVYLYMFTKNGQTQWSAEPQGRRDHHPRAKIDCKRGRGRM